MISKKTIPRYKTLRTAWPVGVCLLLLVHSVQLHADVIPGRWEKVEAQAPGTGLTVIMKSGDRFDCTFEELQMDTLVVETNAGERQIPRSGIARVEASQLVSEPAKDGTLKGAAIGAIAGGVFFGIVGGTLGDRNGAGNAIAGALVIGAIGAGIGAGGGAAIGFAVDYLHKASEVLYVAN